MATSGRVDTLDLWRAKLPGLVRLARWLGVVRPGARVCACAKCRSRLVRRMLRRMGP